MLALLVAIFTLVALPALAQTGEEAGGDTFSVVATVLALSMIVQKVIERIRNRMNLDGDVVLVAAVVLGCAFSFGFGYEAAAELGYTGLAPWLDRAVTGLVIGLGAGGVADFLGRSGSDEVGGITITNPHPSA